MKNKQWFTETTLPGAKNDNKFSLKIKKKIASLKSNFQKIEIFDTYFFGKILVLDGIIQLTEKDEFIYHEVMAHFPLFTHSKPESVLIVGGGDGGVLREVLRHPVKEVFLVEIDEKVIEVSKKYFPFVANGAFNNKKVKIFLDDGSKFIKKYKNYFDVVIIDSTDPLGISCVLFSKKFYKNVFNTLTKNGVMITQSGTFYEQLPQIKKIFRNLKKIFPFVKVYKACIPSYGVGEYSFIVASKTNLDEMNFRFIKNKFKKLNLKTKYYSPEIHFASGILPEYLKIK